jgi:hypothetical protein
VKPLLRWQCRALSTWGLIRSLFNNVWEVVPTNGKRLIVIGHPVLADRNKPMVTNKNEGTLLMQNNN